MGFIFSYLFGLFIFVSVLSYCCSFIYVFKVCVKAACLCGINDVVCVLIDPVYVCVSEQLAEVADTKDQVFPVKDGFHALRGIVNSVSVAVCALVYVCVLVGEAGSE